MKVKYKIIAVDFDDTLCCNAWPDTSKAKQKLIHKILMAWLKYKQRHGWHIHMYTMREDKPLKDKDYLYEACQWCADHGLPIEYANNNPEDMVKKFGASRKVYGDVYIDDHNIGLIGWLFRRAAR